MYHQNFITYVNFVIDFGESKLFVLKVNIFNVIGDKFQLFLYIHYITDDLSYNKLAAQSPIYPSSNTLYFARNAADRNSSTCHIQKGTCYACQPGWIGTTCYTSTFYYEYLHCWFIICFQILFFKN